MDKTSNVALIGGSITRHKVARKMKLRAHPYNVLKFQSDAKNIKFCHSCCKSNRDGFSELHNNNIYNSLKIHIALDYIASNYGLLLFNNRIIIIINY